MMSNHHLASLAALLLLVLPIPVSAQSKPAYVQTHTVANVLAKGIGPETLKVRDLTNGWEVFRLSGSAAEGNTILDVYLAYTGHNPSQNIYYTQGKTISMGNLTFLIAYHRRLSLSEVVPLKRTKAPASSATTPDTTLSLCLINFASVGVLNDIRSFNPASLGAPNRTSSPSR